ncbi:hypothetical protein LPUS_11875 [Lasallia pustulata]|uniref:Uncharacterized protein n=1 Tax=Lasallia pustulata TaxID=136370 RepID=A0A1W5DDF0_9LECA|nr:hypothetical protein LPUS_11875 [Lasallia pustulata]
MLAPPDSTPAEQSPRQPKRFLRRASPETVETSVQPVAKLAKDAGKPSAPASPGRKTSWMSNLSSKFSSSSSNTPTLPSPTSPTVSKAPTSPPMEQPNPSGASAAPGAKEFMKKTDLPAPQAPQPSKSGHPSFIQSALRRLSSTGSGMVPGKMTGSGGVVPRVVLNVNPYRVRSSDEDFEPNKLRRVAFCVDVEIAGTARYAEEEPTEQQPSSPGRRPSLTQLEQQIDNMKKKDKKMKERSEGEALKNPEAVAKAKENKGISDPNLQGETESAPQLDEQSNGELISRKKERKKRSEEERKERKERRRKEAEAKGIYPVEVIREKSSDSSGTSTPDSPTAVGMHTKSQDRPTTDPLRIYRRCCQLRETPILKKITEQLSSPNACDAATPGTISCLDLTGYWMQLQDVVTLGDYLAVVPVKKIILENCGLSDEAVRVILAGLLAAKTPQQAKYNKRLCRKQNDNAEEKTERLGVIEKLCLKNNPQIDREGWRHICAFINMSESLKAIDLSMIPFPDPPPPTNRRGSFDSRTVADMSPLLQKAITERRAGSHLEELVMAECDVNSDQIARIVDGVMKCGLTRLGLASNKMQREGLEHVVRYVQTGKCEGLDLGGNNLREDLHLIAEVLDGTNALYALSLADCNLAASSLIALFPALVRLPNFRFIDLSHNRDLFASRPNALGLLRKYIPQLPVLKRIHLADVAMSSDHAIALAEILPESHSLAHLNILENERLSALASAKDEAGQEEACALYASLMAAVRVSNTLVCIDIDVPSKDSSEIVKALAKQVVAYSLRNMEHGPVAEAYATAAAAIADPHGGEEHVAVPDVLLHLVGHIDGFPDRPEYQDSAPDKDYIVGGTGVVKALGVVLGDKGVDSRRFSRDEAATESGSTTPKQVLQGAEVTTGKAKEMSKNLLESARKIRARLQPALAREARAGNDQDHSALKIEQAGSDTNKMDLGRLVFLDNTLRRMIQRFEDEYPECRLEPPVPPAGTNKTLLDSNDGLSQPGLFSVDINPKSEAEISATDTASLTDDDNDATIKPISRHNSDVSLFSRHLANEEGRMHRFGQQMRREVFRPGGINHAPKSSGKESEAQHLHTLRLRLEAIDGEQWRERVIRLGYNAALAEEGITADELGLLERQDPETFDKLREAQETAQLNLRKGRESTEEVVG